MTQFGQQSHRLVLTGLDGSNPLAFLAALGALRTLSEVCTQRHVRMSWQRAAGWNPVLHVDSPLSDDALVQDLFRGLGTPLHDKAFSLGKDLNVTSREFRAFAEEAVSASTRAERLWADFATAFACDALTNDDGKIQDTALRTMSGAGHQHFLQFMLQLARLTEPEHIRQALFQPWTYDDPGPSLRWDPQDDRRYALRWKDPSTDKIHTVRGANRLAVEGLSMIATAPVGSRLETTGFRGRGKSDTAWTWPIWACPLGPDSVRSLLALGELQTETPSRATLSAIGIAEVYRCRRITVGKYRNFTPAAAV